jgi:hypothetical protein
VDGLRGRRGTVKQESGDGSECERGYERSNPWQRFRRRRWLGELFCFGLAGGDPLQFEPDIMRGELTIFGIFLQARHHDVLE